MAKRYALAFVVIFLICEFAQAQSFYRRNRKTGYTLSLGLGSAAYHGDLTSQRIRLDLSPAVNFGIEFPIENRLSIRGELMWYKLSVDEDKTKDSNENFFVRNLSFKSSNLDISVMGRYQITPTSPRPRTNLTTYVLAGLGATYFNPKAELGGTNYSLQPLMTEGVDYGKIALIIPVGAGLNYRVSYDWSIGLDIVYRFTTTDYLDDVSSEYIDNNSFSDPIAQQLADRRPEVGLAVREAGARRGDSDNNDGYLVILGKLNYHLNQGLYYKRKKRKRSKVFRRR